jgi:hypothetical protein
MFANYINHFEKELPGPLSTYSLRIIADQKGIKKKII